MTAVAVGAVAMLIVGHVLRAVRQATLFPASNRPRNFYLMVGLSLAYVINTLVPLRIGELVRALYVSRRAGLGFGPVAASVIIERVSDLVVVASILAGIGLFSLEPALLALAAAMAVAAVAAFVASALLRRSRRIRLAIWAATSPFNERLRVAMIDMIWTAAQLLGSKVLRHPRFLLLTALMWGAYLVAYALLARALGIDLHLVVVALLGSPLNALVAAGFLSGAVVLITSLASLMILIAGLIADGAGMREVIGNLLRRGLPKTGLSPFAFSGASFARPEDYGVVLNAHFTSRKSALASFGLHGMGGVVVRHLLPGGSDAVAAVVETDGHLAIRKYAHGEAGLKLAEQTLWLQGHRHGLPLTEVVSEFRGETRFHYDMPYFPSARDLYEMVHVLPLADSRRLLRDVVARVADWHEASAGADCSDEALQAYIDRKIIANVVAVLDFARRQLPQRYLINGAEHTFGEWEPMLDRSWIEAQMPSRRTSAIHGDLTIENIVVCPERSPGWYLIDPNQGNMFDTPLIDWAKLMQSLNLGYESLNRGPTARMGDGAIDIMLNRSRIYAELHDGVREQLGDRLGAGAMREIAFHEIVNYLRLIPYKIRQNPAKAMTFFAAASILMRRYAEGRNG